jgi:hypothetical protein
MVLLVVVVVSAELNRCWGPCLLALGWALCGMFRGWGSGRGGGGSGGEVRTGWGSWSSVRERYASSYSGRNGKWVMVGMELRPVLSRLGHVGASWGNIV